MRNAIKIFVQALLYEPPASAPVDIDHEHVTRALPAFLRQLPRETLHEVITLEELQFPALHSGVHYWRQLCGERRFPRREDLYPRDIAGLLRNTALLKVLSGGGDYEYRIVGDAITRAYSVTLQSHKLSDFDTMAPIATQTARSLFRQVVDSRMPLAVRRKTGHDAPGSKFTEAETALLPLGAHDNSVDHVLAFSSFV